MELQLRRIQRRHVRGRPHAPQTGGPISISLDAAITVRHIFFWMLNIFQLRQYFQPELVADTWLNFASAFWFFVTPQPPKPSMQVTNQRAGIWSRDLGLTNGRRWWRGPGPPTTRTRERGACRASGPPPWSSTGASSAARGRPRRVPTDR